MQRRDALRDASAYLTVSEPAVLVIVGLVPIFFLVKERQAIYRRQAEVEKEATSELMGRRGCEHLPTGKLLGNVSQEDGGLRG